MSKEKLMVTKNNGQVVPFNQQYIARSMERTGASHKTVEAILHTIKPKLKNKTRTSVIRKMVEKELQKREPWAAARYGLREAITKMGPAGYNFEKYVASILAAYGYKTKTPHEYQGACISHEIDVTAEKDGRLVFIEAKFRHDFKASINIKDTMATWSRFLDLVDGSKLDLCPHFDEVWIVTNARFTDQSLKFGHCKNMKLIGWNHPDERTFAQMVDLDSLYPITIIKELKKAELEKLAHANLMLCRDVQSMEPDQLSRSTGIPTKRSAEILGLCEMIIDGPNA